MLRCLGEGILQHRQMMMQPALWDGELFHSVHSERTVALRMCNRSSGCSPLDLALHYFDTISANAILVRTMNARDKEIWKSLKTQTKQGVTFYGNCPERA